MNPPVVAVTGATGFLGRHIVTALAQAGATPRILARRPPDPDYPRPHGMEVLRGSLEDAAACAALCDGAIAVVHAAGLIKANSRYAFMRINRDGTAALARAARDVAPARFILISSLAARAPWLSAYAASKRAGEERAQAAYAAAAERLFILRPGVIYGPWDRESLAIFKAAARGFAPDFGPGRVAFIHAADTAAAIARIALGAGEAGIYALADASPSGYTSRELVTEAANALGLPPPRCIRLPAWLLRAAGHASGAWTALRGKPGIFTAGKAREILHPDWSVHPGDGLPASIHFPAIGLVQGFRDTAAWYRAAGWLAGP